MKRREILEATAGAGLLAVAMGCFAMPSIPASADDAELIALCVAFDETEHRYQGLHGEGLWPHLELPEGSAQDAAIGALEPIRDDLVMRIVGMEARTLAGLRARAATIKLYDLDQTMVGQNSFGLMVSALLDDLLAVGAAS